MNFQQITIIGSGNLATNLVSVFKKTNAVVHVNGRNENSVKFLAEKFKIPYSIGIENLPETSDLFIICVPDEIIYEFSRNEILKHKVNNQLVIHTSGGVSLDVISNISNNYGVFYPLQTFTKESLIDFKQIPVCIEANSGFNQDKLIKYALQISDDVKIISSEQRHYIHLAAVFANNFSNRMFAIAEEILNKHQIDFKILMPLIEETLRKIKLNSPGKILTGPAARNDTGTIKKHLELLSGQEDIKELYNVISKNIIFCKNR